MPSKRTIRTRDPHKPITPEILELFDRSKQLFEMEARDGDLPEHLRDELADIEKKLTWTLLPRIFGEHWGSHVVDSPAHPSYFPAQNSRARLLGQNRRGSDFLQA